MSVNDFGAGLAGGITVEEARELRDLTASIAANLKEAGEHAKRLGTLGDFGELGKEAASIASSLETAAETIAELPADGTVASRISRFVGELAADPGVDPRVLPALRHVMCLVSGSPSPFSVVELEAEPPTDEAAMAARLDFLAGQIRSLPGFESLNDEAARAVSHAADLVGGRGLRFRVVPAVQSAQDAKG